MHQTDGVRQDRHCRSNRFSLSARPNACCITAAPARYNPPHYLLALSPPPCTLSASRPVFPKSESAAADASLAPSSSILDVLYLTPLRPGHSRMSIIIGPIISSHLLKMLPRWLYHLSMHEILDGERGPLRREEASDCLLVNGSLKYRP